MTFVNTMDTLANDVAFQEITLQKRMRDLEIMLQRLSSLGDMMANKRDAIVALQERLKALKESGTSGDQLDAELDEIHQLLNEATSSVKSITQIQLDEISKYKSPPERIKIALEAIMYLIHKKVLTWDQIKSEMAKGFINSVLKFNLSKVPLKVVQYVKKEYVSQDKWNIEKLKKASKAMGPLGEWLSAQLTLADVFEQKPQAKEVIAHKLEVAEVTEELETLSKELENLTVEQEQVQISVNETQQEIEHIKNDLEKKKNELVVLRGSRRGSRYSVSMVPNTSIIIPPTLNSKTDISSIPENQPEEVDSRYQSVTPNSESTKEAPVVQLPVATSSKKIQTDEIEEHKEELSQIAIIQPEQPKPQKNIHQTGTFNFFHQQKQVKPAPVQVSVEAIPLDRVSTKSFIMQTDMNYEELEELKREIYELRLLLDERNRMLDDRNNALLANANLYNDVYEKENEVLKREIHELYLLLEDRNKQLNERDNMMISNKNIQTDFDDNHQGDKHSRNQSFNNVQTDTHSRQFSSKNVQTDINSRHSMMIQTEDPPQKIVVDSSTFLANAHDHNPASVKVRNALPIGQDDAGEMNPYVQSIIDDLTKRNSEPDISLAYPESIKDLGNTFNQRNSKQDYTPDQSLNQSQMNDKVNYPLTNVINGGSNMPLINGNNNSIKYIGTNGNTPTQPVVYVRKFVILQQPPSFVQQSPVICQQPSRNNSPNQQRRVSSNNILVSQTPQRVSKTNFMIQGLPSEMGNGLDKSHSPMIPISRVNAYSDNDIKSPKYPPNLSKMTTKITTNVTSEVNYGEFGPKSVYNPSQIDHIIIKNGEAPRKFDNVHRQTGLIKPEELSGVLQSNPNPPLGYSQTKIVLNQPPMEGNYPKVQKYETHNQSNRPTFVTRQIMGTSPILNQQIIGVSPVNGYVSGGQGLRGEPIPMIVRKAQETHEPDVPLDYSSLREDKSNGYLP